MTLHSFLQSHFDRDRTIARMQTSAQRATTPDSTLFKGSAQRPDRCDIRTVSVSSEPLQGSLRSRNKKGPTLVGSFLEIILLEDRKNPVFRSVSIKGNRHHRGRHHRGHHHRGPTATRATATRATATRAATEAAATEATASATAAATAVNKVEVHLPAVRQLRRKPTAGLNLRRLTPFGP